MRSCAMWRRKCIFLAALGPWICPSAPAQEAGNKELTARELFYTAVPSKTAAQPAPPKVTAIRPQPPPAQTARAQKKTPAPPATPPAMVVQAQTTTPAPPRAQSPATAPDGTRILTASTRRTAPAPSSGPALGLRYTISKLVDGKMVEVPADSTFRAGDR